MSCVPIESRKFELGPWDYLSQLVILISTLRGGESRFVPLLVAKIEDSLPALAMPITQSLQPKALIDYIDETKQESASSSSNSSPYSTPPYTNFYPST